MTEQDNTAATETPHKNKGFGCLQVVVILVIGMIIATIATFFAFKYFTQSEFKPTELTVQEEHVLEQKLERFDTLQFSEKSIDDTDVEIRDAETLTPEAYSEEGATREIFFTEKELNSLLASNTDMAKRVAVDLADDLVSAKILLPVPEDFPMFAGTTLRGRAGLQMAFKDGRPIVVLKGVSIMGVPIPNAWLGGMKNVDLVSEFGSNEGFWKSFAEGVEYIEVKEGLLNLKLKE